MQHDSGYEMLLHQDLQEVKEALPAGKGHHVWPLRVEDERSASHIPVEQADMAPLVKSVGSALYVLWQTAVDIIFGLWGTFVLFLILPFCALLIYLDSPGPIFYSQERIGYRGKKFRMLKFRSMRVDAEPDGYAIWANKYDERVTRIGRFMRAVHLDELPQVLNILRGEMSLIGPRPEREEFVTELDKTIASYCHRFDVKPGLTGVAYPLLRVEKRVGKK